MAMANLVATNRLWLRQRVRSIKDRIDQLREVLRLHTQEVEAAAEMARPPLVPVVQMPPVAVPRLQTERVNSRQAVGGEEPVPPHRRNEREPTVAPHRQPRPSPYPVPEDRQRRRLKIWEIKLVGEPGSRKLQVSEVTQPESMYDDARQHLQNQIKRVASWPSHTNTDPLGNFTFTRYQETKVKENWTQSWDRSDRRCSIVGMAQVSGQNCKLHLVMQYDTGMMSPISMRMLFRTDATETCDSTSFMDKDLYKLLMLRAWEHVQTFSLFTGPVSDVRTYAEHRIRDIDRWAT